MISEAALAIEFGASSEDIAPHQPSASHAVGGGAPGRDGCRRLDNADVRGATLTHLGAGVKVPCPASLSPRGERGNSRCCIDIFCWSKTPYSPLPSRERDAGHGGENLAQRGVRGEASALFYCHGPRMRATQLNALRLLSGYAMFRKNISFHKVASSRILLSFKYLRKRKNKQMTESDAVSYKYALRDIVCDLILRAKELTNGEGHCATDGAVPHTWPHQEPGDSVRPSIWNIWGSSISIRSNGTLAAAFRARKLPHLGGPHFAGHDNMGK